MRKQSVILVCEPDLLREMLLKAISNVSLLQVIKPINDIDQLSHALQSCPVDLVIFSIEPHQKIPAAIDAAIASNPATHFIAMTSDGAHFKMRWFEAQERSLDNTTLAELASFLSVQRIDGLFNNETACN